MTKRQKIERKYARIPALRYFTERKAYEIRQLKKKKR